MGIGELTRMPFGAPPLEPAQIELFRAWIDQGAEIPESATATYSAPEAAKKHWGFIAPVRPAVPATIIPTPSACGWRAAELSAGFPSEKAMNWVSMSPRIKSTYTISTPRL